MKFIPMQHRDAQTDWYGKSGLEWHVSHLLCKMNNQMNYHVVTHVFDGKEKQDSTTVNAILKHLLECLKKWGIKAITLRADNAGCYHSGSTIAAIHKISKETDLNVKRISFSEVQVSKICRIILKKKN